MDSIAVFIEGTCIYWSSILIVAGIIAGLSMSLTIYSIQNKYLIGFCFFIPNAVVLSLIISRFLYWFSFPEQFGSMNEAFTSFLKGGYLIPGVILGCIITAVLLKVIRIVPHVDSILDPLAPGLAFMLALFKMSAIFSDVCRGKLFIENPALQKLPFAVETIDANGNVQYRLATFFITSMCLLIICVALISVYIARNNKRGDLFRLFLLMYGLVEVIMDSTRYDAAHLTFPGEALEGLNKASGFMGVGQLFAAFSLIYVFTYFMVQSVKGIGWKLQNILGLIFFVLGFAIAGSAEYLVQRFTSVMSLFYLMMLAGLIIMGISTGALLIVKQAPASFCVDNCDVVFLNKIIYTE